MEIETQGSIGVENELTEKDIREADIVLLATDIWRISGTIQREKSH